MKLMSNAPQLSWKIGFGLFLKNGVVHQKFVFAPRKARHSLRECGLRLEDAPPFTGAEALSQQTNSQVVIIIMIWRLFCSNFEKITVLLLILLLFLKAARVCEENLLVNVKFIQKLVCWACVLLLWQEKILQQGQGGNVMYVWGRLLDDLVQKYRKLLQIGWNLVQNETSHFKY